MRKVIDAIAKSVAFNFLVDGEGAAFIVVKKFHLGGIKTGFTFDIITNCGVFDNHS